MNKLFVNNEEKKILVKEKYEGNIYQYGSTMNDIKPSIILNSKEKWSKKNGSDNDKKFGIKSKELAQLFRVKYNYDIENDNQMKTFDLPYLYNHLHTSVHGISGNQDDIEDRKQWFGRNEIITKPQKSFFTLLYRAFYDITIIILFVAAVVSIGLSFYVPNVKDERDERIEESEAQFLEGIVITVAILLVVLVSAISDYHKERQFQNLSNSQENTKSCNVLRNGLCISVPINDVVVGDVVQLNYGDLIPADGLAIITNGLKTDDSAVTGESEPKVKKVGHNIFLFSGTFVVEGNGRMLVMAVGANSEVGRMNFLLDCDKGEKGEKDDNSAGMRLEKSVLKSKLNKLTIKISIFGAIMGTITVIILILRFSINTYIKDGKEWSNSDIKVFFRYITLGITILVVAIPEGLPLAVTIALAYSVGKMMKENNLVRHLDACETMGCATIICSDKTGTLTRNKMTVVESYIGGKWLTKDNSELDISDSLLKLILEAITVNCNYTSNIVKYGKKDDEVKQVGNRTDCALLAFANSLNVGNYEEIRRNIPEETLFKVYPFDSKRKLMSTVLQTEYGYRVFVKGAGEIILNYCSWTIQRDGLRYPLLKSDRDFMLKNIIDHLTGDGLRVITIAFKDFYENNSFSHEYKIPEDWNNETIYSTDLTLICIVGIDDELRPEVKSAVRKCQQAGISVKMVTGDHLKTAYSVAKKCGIVRMGEKAIIMDGQEFNRKALDSKQNFVQEKFDEIWPDLKVLARASPDQKYLLVDGIIKSKLSKAGEVVAVTGDGTNDKPALRRADVGLAMGMMGTEVAKQAADIILLDDNFSSIVRTVLWGRNVSESVLKFLQFQLTINLTALVIAFLSACIINDTPLSAIQMLWINLIMDGLASLALSTEKPSKELLKLKPTGRNRPLLTNTVIKNIILFSVFESVIILFLVFKGPEFFDIDRGSQSLPSQHHTIIFNTFAFMIFAHEICSRKINNERNTFNGILQNHTFLIIWITSLIIQILMINFGRAALHIEPLTIDQWLWCIFFGILVFIWAHVVAYVPDKYFNLTIF